MLHSFPFADIYGILLLRLDTLCTNVVMFYHIFHMFPFSFSCLSSLRVSSGFQFVFLLELFRLTFLHYHKHPSDAIYILWEMRSLPSETSSVLSVFLHTVF